MIAALFFIFAWGAVFAREQNREETKTAQAQETQEKPGDKAAVKVDEEATGKKTGEDEGEKEEEEDKSLLKASTFSGLKFRSIGPALMSGRISDIAVHPKKHHHWWIAVASGGVWKTTNAGTTWKPVFDNEGSYSIGCVTVDRNNPHIVWVGTGENNSQRSVSFGDGVYKSTNGGNSWKNMGLKESEHIAKIVVDPRDSDVVYVAAQGPLWAPGGDRGLYKTTDGGTTWNLALEISENTGVTDVVMDPRDPDVLYAASYQRRRHVWTLINGGPESAIHKTTDGGKSWTKLGSGLPGGDVGRIGLAISPVDADVLFAIIEAAGDASGFFRSTNRGATWVKRSGHVSVSAQYYQEIVPDPVDVNRVYSLNTRTKVTDDGGKTWTNVGGSRKHVDDHALWIDPDDTDHLVMGCDGGLYESFDRSVSWRFVPNLPLTQFYRVSVDNSFPFYYVYGGTQDNSTQGGPSRTRRSGGIVNSDWFITVGGDGFETQIDPEDPNIVYSQSQYGVLARYDRLTGERINIKPMAGPDEEPLHWNWDSPLIISPHLHTRLYFGANRLFRSDDRGDSWRAVSGNLTRQIDRNKLEIMGKIQPLDAVAKHDSTSIFGNLVYICESPLVEGLIYAGTDDGLIQVTEDNGKSWRREDSFASVPDMTYVSRIEASLHDADTVFAAFDNHKNGDFKPYVVKSTDRGRSWTSIAGDLPERGPVLSLAEDHADNGRLLFAGTEFGVFFTINSGENWIRLKGGLPTIAIRDMEIQRRENDLVLGTFGRSFYILDDYTPLRQVTEESLEHEAMLFPVVKNTWMYIPSRSKAGSQGGSFYTASNPPFGAVFTCYIKESYESLKQKRKKKEKESLKDSGDVYYPTLEELRAEKREEKTSLVLCVRDSAGELVRRINGPASAGFHRVAWDLRYPSSRPGGRGSGPLVLPGEYTVTIEKKADGELTLLCGPERFEIKMLQTASLPAEDREEALAFQMKAEDLQRAVLGADRVLQETKSRVEEIKKAIFATTGADQSLGKRARDIEVRLMDLEMELSGDSLKRSLDEATLPSIQSRVRQIVGTHSNSTSAITQTSRDNYQIAGKAFERALERLRVLVEQDLKKLENELDAKGAPWTPGRIPHWTIE